VIGNGAELHAAIADHYAGLSGSFVEVAPLDLSALLRDVALLVQSDAIVRGLAVRYTAAGTELETVPLSYLMHRTGGGWKIAALVAESSK